MTKKECLKKIAHDFMVAQAGLDYEDRVLTNRNFAGSFFLENSDVVNLRAKKAVIDNIVKNIAYDVFSLSTNTNRKYLPVNFNTDQKIQHLESHIDTLSEEDSDFVLSELLGIIKPILAVQPDPTNRRDQYDYMDNSGKRSALQVHSFDDFWFFNFLSKLVQTIKQAMGIKTSEEKLLERSVDNAERVGVNLGMK